MSTVNGLIDAMVEARETVIALDDPPMYKILPRSMPVTGTIGRVSIDNRLEGFLSVEVAFEKLANEILYHAGPRWLWHEPEVVLITQRNQKPGDHHKQKRGKRRRVWR